MTSPTKEALAAAAARYHQPALAATPTLPATISREAVDGVERDLCRAGLGPGAALGRLGAL